MTAHSVQNEVEHPPLHKRNGETNGRVREQNPELLHWRANVLLDEMMLGAIDIAADESVAPRSVARPATATTTAVGAATTVLGQQSTPPQQYSNGDYHNHPSPRDYRDNEHSASHNAGNRSAHSATSALPLPSDGSVEALGSATSDYAASAVTDEWARPSWHFAEPTAFDQGPPAETSPTQSARDTEDTAATSARERNTNQQPMRPQPLPRNGHYPESASAVAPSSGAQSGRYATGAPPSARSQGRSPDLERSQRGGEQKKQSEQWVFAAEQRYQQLAAEPRTTPPVSGAAPTYDGWSAPANYQAGYPGTRQGVEPQLAAAQEQSNSAARYNRTNRPSNLLPRMSATKPQALQQEMVMLQSEIENVLPPGHESYERAQHLLQKAYAILQADPLRSAEVDYYLQQVRKIVERVQETVHWSTLYRNKLRTYLSAWILLSVIVLVTRYTYQGQLSITIAGWGGGPSRELFAYNVLTAFSTFFAGALGGAVGALANMRTQIKLEHGFFDRKYSLRGLILPLIGAVFGVVLCVILGLFYLLFHIDPAVSVLWNAIPALLAFGFGVTQEFIYGTHSEW
ncbi:MAG: hypothetical protein R3C14_05150 [Caldilineaceae bacterium]